MLKKKQFQLMGTVVVYETVFISILLYFIQ